MHGFIIGEHGDSEVPVWSLANIAGMRLRDFCTAQGMTYDEAAVEEIFRQTRDAAYHIIARKGATYYAVVAEGARYDAEALVAYFREHHARIGFDLRATTLGHVQRGGAPTVYDRVLATRLGVGAVAALALGEMGVLVGMEQGRVVHTLLTEIVGLQKPIDPELFTLARILNQ